MTPSKGLYSQSRGNHEVSDRIIVQQPCELYARVKKRVRRLANVTRLAKSHVFAATRACAATAARSEQTR